VFTARLLIRQLRSNTVREACSAHGPIAVGSQRNPVCGREGPFCDPCTRARSQPCYATVIMAVYVWIVEGVHPLPFGERADLFISARITGAARGDLASFVMLQIPPLLRF